SVLELTDRILAADSDHAEGLRIRREAARRLAQDAAERAAAGARAEARALSRRALVLLPGEAELEAALRALERPAAPAEPPGVRTRPPVVVEDRPIVLSAVLEPGVEVDARPHFVVKRGSRTVERALEATRGAGGAYEAAYTFSSAGNHQVLFRIGEGAERVEMRAQVEVARNPSSRPPRRSEPDPPPVTTQGSTWSPPTIAPAWTPTTPAPNSPPPTPTPPAPVVEQRPPDPPPPPAPWTGGGSVL